MDKTKDYSSALGRDWKVKMSRLARNYACPACKAGPDIKCDTLYSAPGRATCDARIFAAADAEIDRLSKPRPENVKRAAGWSGAEDADLRSMWMAGDDIYTIADRLGRTPRAVIWRLSDQFAVITIEVRDEAGALRGVIESRPASTKHEAFQEQAPSLPPVDVLEHAEDFQRRLGGVHTETHKETRT